MSEALHLLAIAEKLDVACAIGPVRVALGIHLGSDSNPLRAWATAVKYELGDARRAAARRVILGRNPIIEEPIPELQYVSGLDSFNLLRAKQQAEQDARTAIQSVHWGCSRCGQSRAVPAWKEPWLRRVDERVLLQDDIESDDFFKTCMSPPGCSTCPSTFNNYNAMLARESLQRTMEEIRQRIRSECVLVALCWTMF